MAFLLDLRPGRLLLDVGAGAGWPGLYLVEETGCDAVLVDLPGSGLHVANEKAQRNQSSDHVRITAADGSKLPFRDGTFDAVSHCEALCCLADKRGVLEACRRVIRKKGIMVFTVISITPGLCSADHKRAVDAAPELCESEMDYPDLLATTGWTVIDCLDVSEAYGATTSTVAEGLVRRDLFVAAPD